MYCVRGSVESCAHAHTTAITRRATHCHLPANMKGFSALLLCVAWTITAAHSHTRGRTHVDPEHTLVWGPGLQPHTVVMPARYFYVHAVDTAGNKLEQSPDGQLTVHISGTSDYNSCRTWINVLDRKDGSFIIRYKTYYTCYDVLIHVQYNGVHVGGSPFIVEGPMYPDTCYCPESNLTQWLNKFHCKNSYRQIDLDLQHFTAINFTAMRDLAIDRFNNPGSMSICNYIVKENKVYRKCYGQYIGFKMFMDAILLSLTRKVALPDMELLVNLGDWPLVSADQGMVLPVFSWCGSEDSHDIVMPTYDITEASLECMGRVMLDMMSVQANIERGWDEKIEKAFWRGRDSRRERLQLIDIARML